MLQQSFVRLKIDTSSMCTKCFKIWWLAVIIRTWVEVFIRMETAEVRSRDHRQGNTVLGDPSQHTIFIRAVLFNVSEKRISQPLRYSPFELPGLANALLLSVFKRPSKWPRQPRCSLTARCRTTDGSLPGHICLTNLRK